MYGESNIVRLAPETDVQQGSASRGIDLKLGSISSLTSLTRVAESSRVGFELL